MMFYSIIGFSVLGVMLVKIFLKWYDSTVNLGRTYGIKEIDLRRYANKVMDEEFHKRYRAIQKGYRKGVIIWLFYLFLFVFGFILLAVN